MVRVRRTAGCVAAGAVLLGSTAACVGALRDTSSALACGEIHSSASALEVTDLDGRKILEDLEQRCNEIVASYRLDAASPYPLVGLTRVATADGEVSAKDRAALFSFVEHSMPRAYGGCNTLENSVRTRGAVEVATATLDQLQISDCGQVAFRLTIHNPARDSRPFEVRMGEDMIRGCAEPGVSIHELTEAALPGTHDITFWTFGKDKHEVLAARIEVRAPSFEASRDGGILTFRPTSEECSPGLWALEVLQPFARIHMTRWPLEHGEIETFSLRPDEPADLTLLLWGVRQGPRFRLEEGATLATD